MAGDDDDRPSGYASPPCLASEIAPEYFDPLGALQPQLDPQQALDVARWRRAQRSGLLAARQALSVDQRLAVSQSIARHLAAALQAPIQAGAQVVAVYWPIRGEPDLRPIMRALHDQGLRVALPLVEAPKTPLAFRRWTPQTVMQRGHWNIPVPPPEAESLQPDIAIAPLVGWDRAAYRLGYGGGYFDRTLAAQQPRPFVIGVGYQQAELATIYPQPHDISLNCIITEDGAQVTV